MDLSAWQVVPGFTSPYTIRYWYQLGVGGTINGPYVVTIPWATFNAVQPGWDTSFHSLSEVWASNDDYINNTSSLFNLGAITGTSTPSNATLQSIANSISPVPGTFGQWLLNWDSGTSLPSPNDVSGNNRLIQVAHSFEVNGIAIQGELAPFQDGITPAPLQDETYLTLTPTQVNAGGTATLTVTASQFFQVDRLGLDPTVAINFAITDIRANGVSQWNSSGAVPASLFAVGSIIEKFDFLQISAGQSIQIDVLNTSAIAQTFSGIVYGRTASTISTGFKRAIMGMGRTSVAINGTATISLSPPSHFQLIRIAVSTAVSDYFSITNITYNGQSILTELGLTNPTPCSAVSELVRTAVAKRPYMAGTNNLQFSVTNTTSDTAKIFAGTLIGKLH